MSQGDPIDALLAAVDQEDREALRPLVVPIAGGSAASVPRPRWRKQKATVPSATSSYVGGHPFLPSGQQWPVDQRGEPLHFVAQVSFAEVPGLPDFPERGELRERLELVVRVR